jgi:AcrR family transcriptional regulator
MAGQAVREPRRLTPKGEAMRARLIDSAAAAFAEHGYVGTRVSDIVARAGTAHGNFYRHFEDKNAILLAVLRPRLAALREATRGMGEAGDRQDRLVAVNVAYFHQYARDRRLLSVMREATALRSSDFQELWLAERGAFIARTRRWLERLVASGAADPPGDLGLLAEALGALTEQLAYVHVALPAEAPSPERLDELGRTCGRIWYDAVFGARTA